MDAILNLAGVSDVVHEYCGLRLRTVSRSARVSAPKSILRDVALCLVIRGGFVDGLGIRSVSRRMDRACGGVVLLPVLADGGMGDPDIISLVLSKQADSVRSLQRVPGAITPAAGATIQSYHSERNKYFQKVLKTIETMLTSRRYGPNFKSSEQEILDCTRKIWRQGCCFGELFDSGVFCVVDCFLRAGLQGKSACPALQTLLLGLETPEALVTQMVLRLLDAGAQVTSWMEVVRLAHFLREQENVAETVDSACESLVEAKADINEDFSTLFCGFWETPLCLLLQHCTGCPVPLAASLVGRLINARVPIHSLVLLDVVKLFDRANDEASYAAVEETFKVLVDAGADVNEARPRQDDTPLTDLLQNRTGRPMKFVLSFLRLLLDHGAQISPLALFHLVRLARHVTEQDSFELLNEAFVLLVSRGADVNHVLEDHVISPGDSLHNLFCRFDTPLVALVRNEFRADERWLLPLAERFVEAGAGLSCAAGAGLSCAVDGNQQMSLLVVAVERGSIAFVKFLLDKGCDPNARLVSDNSFNGWPVLHYYVRFQFRSCEGIVQALLDAGADPDIRVSRGAIGAIFQTAAELDVAHQFPILHQRQPQAS